MTSEQDIENIVRELKSLQLRQNSLIARLETLGNAGESGTSRARAGQGTRNDSIRTFAIGDKVAIRNPRPLQASKGTVTKIGMNRITVTARNGSTIVRHPKNLRIIEDE